MRISLCILLTLNLMSCSIFHGAQNQHSEDKLSQLIRNALRKEDSKQFLKASKKWERRFYKENPKREISVAKAKNVSLAQKALDKRYKYFIYEVNYKITEGVAQKDQNKVLSGLQSLGKLLPQNFKENRNYLSEPGRKKALALIESIHRLQENHIETFSKKEPSHKDYQQVAKDYKNIINKALEYFIASSQQDKVLRDFVHRNSQVAGVITLPIIAAGAIALLGSVIAYFSWRGIQDDQLIAAIFVLKSYLRSCSSKSLEKLIEDHENYNRFKQNLYRYFGSSYGDAVKMFCSQELEDINQYKSMYGSPLGYRWGQKSICQHIEASPDKCFFRQWLCENVKVLKQCFQTRNIQIQWSAH